jgi:tetratricopeptide (TPR) repeat protein
MQPDLVLAYEVYSQLHFNQGNYQQVIKDCEKILSITPDDPPALIYMSLAYIRLGYDNKAEEEINKMPPNSFFQNNANVLLSYLNKKKNNVNESRVLIQNVKQKLEKKFSDGDEFNHDAIIMFYIEIIGGNKSEAYKWLYKSIDWGFRDAELLLNHPITEDIRNEKQFQDCIQKIKGKVKEQQNLIASMNKGN